MGMLPVRAMSAPGRWGDWVKVCLSSWMLESPHSLMTHWAMVSVWAGWLPSWSIRQGLLGVVSIFYGLSPESEIAGRFQVTGGG